MGDRWWGYRRPDGAAGARNHVVILPVDDLSNRAAEMVAAQVVGPLALSHPYGRLQYGADLELLFRTLIGLGRSPNVFGAVVIGIEPVWTQRVAEGIAQSGKEVAAFSIEEAGDLRTVERASRAAARLVQAASEQRREEVDASELVVSIKCGESDTTSGLASNPTVGKVVDRLVSLGATVLFGETSELTGAEDVVAERMVRPELRERFLAMYRAYVEEIRSHGADLLGSQPTEGNIRGGLSTIEEKALGNIQKLGTSPVVGVLEPAEPPQAKGLHFMDTSSAAAEAVTLFAAAGAHVHLFPTGQGNVVGNPILPVVKLSANPKTCREMSEHIDLQVDGLLTGERSLEEAAEELFALTLRVASGRLTAAEVLGHRELALTRLYRSA